MGFALPFRIDTWIIARDQEAVVSRESFGQPRDAVREIDGRIVIKVPLGDIGLDLTPRRTRHDREGLRRAEYFEDPEFRLRIATPEDPILCKIQSWRHQD